MFHMPSKELPDGVDGIIALAVDSSNNAKLASTRLFNSQSDAWSAVCNGILNDMPAVAKYWFLQIKKTDIDMCYIIDAKTSGTIKHLMCINAGYREFNNYDVYFSNYEPFYIVSVQNYNSMKCYTDRMYAIKHYQLYNKARDVFDTL